MAEVTLGAGVLVIDDDSTCLTIVSAMLRKLGHEVVTAKNPLDALCTLRTKHELFGLVLSDVHMPQMSGIELQKQVAAEFEMPVVLMSGDDKKDLMLEALKSGAIFFIIKPIQVDDLKNLWQLAITGRKGASASNCKDSQIENLSQDDSNFSAASSGYERKYFKRKASSNEVGEDEDKNLNPKKQKLVWTISLHNRFLEAVEKIGFNKAVPKKILQHMKVPGLTRDHVASHLQKYRLFLKRVSARSSSAEHERSWKERPLGSKLLVSRRQLIAPHLNFQDEEGLKGFAHLNMKPRSVIGVSSNQLHAWSITPSDLQRQMVDGGDNTHNLDLVLEMNKGKEVSSYGSRLADEEATFQVQFELPQPQPQPQPQQDVNLQNQCAADSNHVGINAKQQQQQQQLGFVGTISNRYHGGYGFGNKSIWNNTNQGENNIAAALPVVLGDHELEKHAGCGSFHVSEFDGIISFTQLLDSSANGTTTHGNLYRLADQEIPPHLDLPAETSLLQGQNWYGDGPGETSQRNIQKSTEENFQDFEDLMSSLEDTFE